MLWFSYRIRAVGLTCRLKLQRPIVNRDPVVCRVVHVMSTVGSAILRLSEVDQINTFTWQDSYLPKPVTVMLANFTHHRINAQKIKVKKFVMLRFKQGHHDFGAPKKENPKRDKHSLRPPPWIRL